MDDIKVERLLINYKTLEEFKRFKEYGHQELSMLEDLQNNIVENDSESPFYGIYYGKNLVARMSLYKIKKKYDEYRSEEHTSELQSRGHLVCRLLLEKKNKKK